MVSAIVLAAGLSTRMGDENKLLLPWKGTTVIAYVVEHLLSSDMDEIIVVLGYEADLVKKAIGLEDKITFVINESYEKGMTTSIQKGVAVASNESKGLMICLGDLVLMESIDYDEILRAWKNNFTKNEQAIVLPFYENKRGNPIVFSASHKKAILKHTDMNGCKGVVRANTEHLLKLDFSNDHILKDIDTKEAYTILNLE